MPVNVACKNENKKRNKYIQGKQMLKGLVAKLFIGALVASSPVNTNTYITTGTYYTDSQTVIDSTGEEWGYDTEYSDGTPVIITFDSQGTDSRYDDVVTSVTAIQ